MYARGLVMTLTQLTIRHLERQRTWHSCSVRFRMEMKSHSQRKNTNRLHTKTKRSQVDLLSKRDSVFYFRCQRIFVAGAALSSAQLSSVRWRSFVQLLFYQYLDACVCVWVWTSHLIETSQSVSQFHAYCSKIWISWRPLQHRISSNKFSFFLTKNSKRHTLRGRYH